MKKVVLLIVFHFFQSFSYGQVYLEWQKCLGGSSSDDGSNIQQLKNGNFILIGSTLSKDGDINKQIGNNDIFVALLNSSGDIIWKNTYGSSTRDDGFSIIETNDGGFILTAYVSSSDENVTGVHGTGNAGDIWVAKLDINGNIQWQKCYGGTDLEGYSGFWGNTAAIKQATDGGYILITNTESVDGDVFGNNRDSNWDGWIVKIDNMGNILWQKRFGGPKGDFTQLRSVVETSDGGFINVGATGSFDIKGFIDLWVSKLNSAGVSQWDKVYGGSMPVSILGIDIDVGVDVKQTNDGGFIVLSGSTSQDGDITDNHGGADIWILKLNSLGDIQWKKSYGSTGDEEGNSILVTSNGYIVCGSDANKDIWIFEIDINGNKKWERTYGGTNNESISSAYLTSDGIIAIGSTESNDKDVKGNHGSTDIWVIKLKNCPTAILNLNVDTTACNQPSYKSPSGKTYTTASTFKDTVRYTYGCDSAYYNINLKFVNRQTRPDTSVNKCLKQPYTLPWTGRKVSVANTYTDTLRTSKGCDSLIRNVVITLLNVKMNPDTNVSFCPGKTYTLPYTKRIISTAGKEPDTLRGFEGCDSLIRNVILSFTTPQYLADTSVSICPSKGYTLPFSKKIITTVVSNQGDTLRSIQGCDSLIKRFTITFKTFQTLVDTSVAICPNKSYKLPLSGRVVSMATDYTDNLLNKDGCDSIIRKVTITYKTPITLPTVFKTICNGGSEILPYKKRVVTTEQIHRDTVLGFEGCDSAIYVLQLSVYKPKPNIINIQGCFNEPKVYNSKTYTPQKPSGADTLRGLGAYGCDSIIQVVVTFEQSNAVNDTYNLNLDKALDTIVKVFTNDNIVGAFKVSIEDPIKIGTAKANDKGEISMSIPSNALASSNFTYKLCTTNCPNQCSVGKVTLVFAHSESNNFKEAPLIITPNGDGINDDLIIEGIDQFPLNNLTVINRWGQQVYYAKPYKNDWHGTNQAGHDLPDGTYFYSVDLNLNDRKVQWGSITIKR
jgi:gliding motility-associated-like protein